MFRLLVSSRSSRVSLFGVVVATVHQALNARVRETRASVISPLLSLFSLSSLSLSLSLSLSHTHAALRRLSPHDSTGALSASRHGQCQHMPVHLSNHLLKKAANFVFLFIY
jgi:hypothetical protein